MDQPIGEYRLKHAFLPANYKQLVNTPGTHCIVPFHRYIFLLSHTGGQPVPSPEYHHSAIKPSRRLIGGGNPTIPRRKYFLGTLHMCGLYDEKDLFANKSH